MPAQVAGRVGATVEGVGQPVDEGIRRLAAEATLQVDLRRHDHGHAEQQRYPEPAQPVVDEGTGRARAQGKQDGPARDQEDEGHAPAVHEAHGLAQRRERVIGLEVPGPARPRHAGVVGDQQAEGENAQPVEVGTAGRGHRDTSWVDTRSYRSRH